jgi:methyl-accepting chemotaxis protein
MKRFVLVAWVACATIVMPVAGRAQPPVGAEVQRMLASLSSYTELRLESVRQCLQLLASTAEAQSARWDDIRPLVTGYQERDPSLAAWFALPDGTYYTASQGLMEVKLSDRAYFGDLLAGNIVHGALVISKSTGKRSAVIAVPVMKDGRMVAAVGASLFLELLSDQLSAMLSLPAGTSFFALSPDGLTALHSRQDRHFLDPRELGSPSLKEAAGQMLSTTEGHASYALDGVKKHVVYSSSAPTGWRFAITSNED